MNPEGLEASRLALPISFYWLGGFNFHCFSGFAATSRNGPTDGLEASGLARVAHLITLGFHCLRVWVFLPFSRNGSADGLGLEACATHLIMLGFQFLLNVMASPLPQWPPEGFEASRCQWDSFAPLSRHRGAWEFLIYLSSGAEWWSVPEPYRKLTKNLTKDLIGTL